MTIKNLMGKFLTVKIAGSSGIVIQDCTETGYFSQFAELLGIDLNDGISPGRVASELRFSASGHPGEVIYSDPAGELQLRFAYDEKTIEVIVDRDVLNREKSRMLIWHYLVDCAGAAMVLQGIPAFLVHGALLMDADDGAIMLCGDGGVGKSTTSRRWEESGGKFAADDMFLLEYGSEEGLYVRSLPTWSRCMIAPELSRLPVDRPLPVTGVLGLSRGADGDTVEAVSYGDFMGQILRSLCFHTKGIVKRLPPGEQGVFSKRAALAAGLITDKFPPCGLFANLNGDLNKAIRDYREKFTRKLPVLNDGREL